MCAKNTAGQVIKRLVAVYVKTKHKEGLKNVIKNKTHLKIHISSSGATLRQFGSLSRVSGSF